MYVLTSFCVVLACLPTPAPVGPNGGPCVALKPHKRLPVELEVQYLPSSPEEAHLETFEVQLVGQVFYLRVYLPLLLPWEIRILHGRFKFF